MKERKFIECEIWGWLIVGSMILLIALWAVPAAYGVIVDQINVNPMETFD